MSTFVERALGPDSRVAHALPFTPASIPPVPPRVLLAAWDSAREGAALGLRGPERALFFAAGNRAAPGSVRLDLSDPDARCWAEAIDLTLGLGTVSGMAVLLRLLALLDAMGRLPWLRGMFEISAGEAELHPALLGAAAELPLDPAARLDETSLRRRLSRLPAGARS